MGGKHVSNLIGLGWPCIVTFGGFNIYVVCFVPKSYPNQIWYPGNTQVEQWSSQAVWQKQSGVSLALLQLRTRVGDKLW